MTITMHKNGNTIGRKVTTEAGEVEHVGANVQADIDYRPFTRHYRGAATLKFVVIATGRRYATLEAAARAVIKNRAA